MICYQQNQVLMNQELQILPTEPQQQQKKAAIIQPTQQFPQVVQKQHIEHHQEEKIVAKEQDAHIFKEQKDNALQNKFNQPTNQIQSHQHVHSQEEAAVNQIEPPIIFNVQPPPPSNQPNTNEQAYAFKGIDFEAQPQLQQNNLPIQHSQKEAAEIIYNQPNQEIIFPEEQEEVQPLQHFQQEIEIAQNNRIEEHSVEIEHEATVKVDEEPLPNHNQQIKEEASNQKIKHHENVQAVQAKKQETTKEQTLFHQLIEDKNIELQHMQIQNEHKIKEPEVQAEAQVLIQPKDLEAVNIKQQVEPPVQAAIDKSAAVQHQNHIDDKQKKQKDPQIVYIQQLQENKELVDHSEALQNPINQSNRQKEIIKVQNEQIAHPLIEGGRQNEHNKEQVFQQAVVNKRIEQVNQSQHQEQIVEPPSDEKIISFEVQHKNDKIQASEKPSEVLEVRYNKLEEKNLVLPVDTNPQKVNNINQLEEINNQNCVQKHEMKPNDGIVLLEEQKKIIAIESNQQNQANHFDNFNQKPALQINAEQLQQIEPETETLNVIQGQAKPFQLQTEKVLVNHEQAVKEQTEVIKRVQKEKQAEPILENLEILALPVNQEENLVAHEVQSNHLPTINQQQETNQSQPVIHEVIHSVNPQTQEKIFQQIQVNQSESKNIQPPLQVNQTESQNHVKEKKINAEVSNKDEEELQKFEFQAFQFPQINQATNVQKNTEQKIQQMKPVNNEFIEKEQKLDQEGKNQNIVSSTSPINHQNVKVVQHPQQQNLHSSSIQQQKSQQLIQQKKDGDHLSEQKIEEKSAIQDNIHKNENNQPSQHEKNQEKISNHESSYNHDQADNNQQNPFDSIQQQLMAQTIKKDTQNIEKQRYRLNTQKVENLQDQKDKSKQIVEFIEFNQEEKIQPPKQSEPIIKQADNTTKPQVKQVKKEENTLNIAFSPSRQSEKANEQPYNTIETTNLQIQSRKKRLPEIQQSNQLKQGVGKIARKIIPEKRVQDVIEDLKKHDITQAKKSVQKRPTSRRKTIDASKFEHIGLKSNIINVTVGQLLSKNEEVQAEKLLDEIDELKKKLYQLEKRKQLVEMAQSGKVEKIQKQTKQTLLANKSKLYAGKIYRRESNNSRVAEQVQTLGTHVNTSQKFSSGLINSATVSSAPRQRFSSTQDFFAPRQTAKEHEMENKTGPILFRVKRNSKMHGTFDFNSNEKQPGYIKSKQFESEDKCFQARRQEHQKLQFAQAQKFSILQKPEKRQLTFQQNFKEKTDAFFIQLSKQLPRKDWNQEQLVETAKQTFKRFGVNIQNLRNLTLSVKKYKNCVSFIIDSNRTVLWYYEGKFYYGGWKINLSGEGQKNGWGYDYSPGKYVYSGSFLQNKRDGYGIIKLLTREEDIIYQGEWKNGLKHGQGKQRQADGSEYIGEWMQGKKSGKGKIKGPDDEFFEGFFLNGVKNGEGSQKFKNGDSYQGNYYDGKFHGMGVYLWANQSRYEGQFKQGSRNGNGIWLSNYKDQNSDRYEGQYKNDRKNGFGVYRWKDGTVYQGQFLNDLKHGEGIVSCGDGKSTKLQWFEGNVVPKKNTEKPRTGTKRSISKSSSKKNQEKNSQTKAPLIKFNINHSESKSKPTRMSLGIQQM